MKSIYFLLFILIFSNNFSQSYNEIIDELLEEVNLDSLVSYVRVLSGEDSVYINDQMVRIVTRRATHPDKFLAADYIYNKLNKFGLVVEFQDFISDGRNVIALQEGSKYPEQYYIICAHFDSVADYCADDNASGTAAVIESARILSTQKSDYSIIYALWDYEEIGLTGSGQFAANAEANGMDIKGVINLDMIGYDSNDDGLMEIHTRESFVPTINEFVEPIIAVNSIYNIELNPVLFNPGTLASDHTPFLGRGYPAALLIEGYYSGDFNQFYHSNNDRIDKFNLGYFHKMTKLAFASLANFVLPENVTGSELEILASDYILYQNYPNPFNPTTNISYSIPQTSYVTLTIYDVLGKLIKTMISETQSPGNYIVRFDASYLPSGTYFYSITSDNFRQTRKMLVLK